MRARTAGRRPSSIRRAAPRRRELSCLIAAVLASGAAVEHAAARDVPFAEPPAISNTAGEAFAVFAADVDGDGDLDALSALSYDNKIAWYENDGTGGTWTLHTITTSAIGASSVFAADVDGDGDLDALSTSYFDNQITWYENIDGDGSTWTLHTISTTAYSALSVFAGDVDGDGDMDALSASSADNKIAWYENINDDGSAWSLHTISTSTSVPRSVFAGDLDGDGDLDALSASRYDDKIAWYENLNGDGSTWTLHTISTTAKLAHSVFAADVDGDGDLDALSASIYENKIAWYENDGTGGTWMLHTISTTAYNAISVFAADVDGDGDLDALSASYSDNKIAWYENLNGDGSTWTLHTISTNANEAISVFAGDVDGDGDLDALSASKDDDKIAWYRNDTIHRSAVLPQEVLISTSAYGANDVAAADVDGDGDTDALSASNQDDKIAWYENTAGDGSNWTIHTITTSAEGATSVFAADVDGDGDLDALSASDTDGKIAWYENVEGDGSTPWTAHTITTSADRPQSVFATDVDGDGDIDAFSGSLNEPEITWYENTAGDGSSWNTHTIARVNSARSVFAADVDSDGDQDALSASISDDKIAWYENDGTGGGWALHTISNNADRARSVFAADVDGDGDVDALSASRFDNKIAWYENDGTGGGWMLHTISTNANEASSVFAGDVDGDGDVDVLSTSSEDDKIAWYENTAGDGSSWTTHTITTSRIFASGVVTADVDGDGDLDALSASLDHTIAWYENRGGQFALPTLNTAQKIVNNSETHDLLDIEAMHRGRTGDSDAELVTIELKLTDGSGTDLTSTEANNLIEELRIHLDDGSGEFDGAPTDTAVHTITNFDLTAGVETIEFLDGNANALLPFGSPKVYFAVADLTADADSQSPSAFEITHITESSSTGEDAAHDIPLTLEFWPDTGTGVVDTALSTTSCSAPFDLQLIDRTVSDTLTCEAGTILSAETFELTGSADVTFRSGDTVTLRPGFSVQAGQFAVVIDPTLKP